MPRKPSDIPTPTGQAFEALVPDWPGSLKESAQNVWLSGLGALAKAQAEGGKAFETLVQEGMLVQRKTQEETQERLTELGQRMSQATASLSTKATDQWDKLEGIFENRVAKALHQLGMPVAADLQALSERIDALEQQVRALQEPTPASPVQPRKPRRKAAPPAA